MKDMTPAAIETLLHHCKRALDATNRMRNTPIVDDDFPQMRDECDMAVNTALASLREAGIE